MPCARRRSPRRLACLRARILPTAIVRWFRTRWMRLFHALCPRPTGYDVCRLQKRVRPGSVERGYVAARTDRRKARLRAWQYDGITLIERCQAFRRRAEGSAHRLPRQNTECDAIHTCTRSNFGSSNHSPQAHSGSKLCRIILVASAAAVLGRTGPAACADHVYIRIRRHT